MALLEALMDALHGGSSAASANGGAAAPAAAGGGGVAPLRELAAELCAEFLKWSDKHMGRKGKRLLAAQRPGVYVAMPGSPPAAPSALSHAGGHPTARARAILLPHRPLHPPAPPGGNFNAVSLLRRLFDLLSQPGPAQRLGGATALTHCARCDLGEGVCQAACAARAGECASGSGW